VQYLPEKEDLLEAVAFFLAKQAAPAAEDPALAFRLRVAAHLVHGAARESRAEGRQDREVASLLSQTLGIELEAATDSTQRHAQIRELFERLTERIRDPAIDEESLGELRRVFMKVLATELQIVQPKFDLSLHVETPREP